MDKLTIWVTGANRGIGGAIAKRMAQEDSKIILSASKQESFKSVISDYADKQNIYFFPFDLRSSDSINSTVKKIKNSVGEVDVLINNAGVSVNKLFHELTEEDFDLVNDVNYKGIFLLTKAVVKDMIKRKDGIIININSIANNETFLKGSIYSASKAAALALSRNLRNEVREHGIKVIDVIPGATETDMWDDDNREKYRDRMMQPEDIADALYKIIELCKRDRMMVEEITLRPQGGNI